MSPEARSKTSTERRLLRFVAEAVRARPWPLGLGLLCAAAEAAGTAAQTALLKGVLDEIFFRRDARLLFLLPLALLLTALVKGAAYYGQAVAMKKVVLRIVGGIQTALVSHLMRLDLGFFQQNAPGGLLSRFLSDLALLRDVVAEAIGSLPRDALTVLFLGALMFRYDPALAVAALAVLPLALLPLARLSRRQRALSRAASEAVGGFADRLEEMVQGARDVKADGMEDYEVERAAEAVRRMNEATLSAVRARTTVHVMGELLGALGTAAVVVYGGSRVIAGSATPGTFFLFLAVAVYCYRPARRLLSFNFALQEGLAAAERALSLLDLEPSVRDLPGARPLEPVRGEVQLSGVSFGYREGRPVLCGIDLAAHPGQIVALVGASGAGKTSIVNLVPRFFDPWEGRVTVDGRDVREATLASLRARVGLVSQETVLLFDTVRANIAYGRPGATEAEVRRAAALAGAAAFIESLPRGYDTVVGVRGSELSAGERQRIAIARAFLKDAPILLLDEATSNLDAETERQVQGSLARLMEGRTTIVVAHRLHAVAAADAIYVLAGGRVAEVGRHAELLARGGPYAQLHAAFERAAPARATERR